MTISSTAVPEHALALLDTSCVIEFPDQMDELAQAAAVSALTIAELAYGSITTILSSPPRARSATGTYSTSSIQFRIPPGQRTCTEQSPHRSESRGEILDPDVSI